MTVGVSEFGYDVLRWHLSQAVCICQVHAAQTPRYSMQLCTTGYLVLHLQQRLKRMRQLAAGLSVLAVQSSVGLPAGRNNCAEKGNQHHHHCSWTNLTASQTSQSCRICC